MYSPDVVHRQRATQLRDLKHNRFTGSSKVNGISHCDGDDLRGSYNRRLQPDKAEGNETPS